MKIHIYTDIPTLFGQACRIWMDVLLDAGHDAEFIDIGTGNQLPLPAVGASDVNLLVAGIYAMARFKTWGLPGQGKNVLWMFDPLTKQRDAVMHNQKSVAFDAIAAQLDAVIAMDSSIAAYVCHHHPGLTVTQIPYLVARKNIRVPLAESDRTGGVIFMGGHTARRATVHDRLAASHTQAEFVWAGLWGSARDDKRRHSRVSLNIHADAMHSYFDQYRTLEAWAAGTAVVTETTDDLALWGIVPDTHLVMANLQDLPEVCAELLADTVKREHITRAAQDLLHSQFSPQRWRQKMLSALENIA